MTISAERYHDISCGHRVAGHESKCAMLHGHNYRVHFKCEAEPGSTALDDLGRVMDFSVIKAKLCAWIEENWDHKFLAFREDRAMQMIAAALSVCSKSAEEMGNAAEIFERSIVWVHFNPTAENMALFLLDTVGPTQLAGTGVRLVEVKVEETRKCSASATRGDISLFGGMGL